jgi:hypothetical protein
MNYEQQTDWGERHPTWDGTETRNFEGINKRAMHAMVAFYLGRGFMEAPTWQEIGDDERFGWRSVIRAFDRGEIPHADKEGG